MRATVRGAGGAGDDGQAGVVQAQAGHARVHRPLADAHHVGGGRPSRHVGRLAYLALLSVYPVSDASP